MVRDIKRRRDDKINHKYPSLTFVYTTLRNLNLSQWPRASTMRGSSSVARHKLGGGWGGETDKQTGTHRETKRQRDTERQKQRARETETETERDRETDRDRQTDRQTDRQRQTETRRDRDTDRQTHRYTDRDRETDTETERSRETEIERDRYRERGGGERDRQRDRHRDIQRHRETETETERYRDRERQRDRETLRQTETEREQGLDELPVLGSFLWLAMVTQSPDHRQMETTVYNAQSTTTFIQPERRPAPYPWNSGSNIPWNI